MSNMDESQNIYVDNELIWRFALSCFFRSFTEWSSSLSTGITTISKRVQSSYEFHSLVAEGAIQQ